MNQKRPKPHIPEQKYRGERDLYPAEVTSKAGAYWAVRVSGLPRHLSHNRLLNLTPQQFEGCDPAVGLKGVVQYRVNNRGGMHYFRPVPQVMDESHTAGADRAAS